MRANMPTFTIPDRLRLGTPTPAARDTRLLLLFATLLTIGLNFLPYSQILLYPLRLFITFVHESGHAFATLLIGGGVVSLAVSPDTSGVTGSIGGSFMTSWIVNSAGYLGTTLFGAMLLQIGRLKRVQNAGRTMLFTLAATMLGIMIWARDPFTLLVGLSLSGIFWFLALKMSARAAEFIAMFLAVQCSLNALIDLRTLIYISTSMPTKYADAVHSDALNMEHMYLLPAVFWAFLWAIIAVLILGASLWSYLRATSQRSL